MNNSQLSPERIRYMHMDRKIARVEQKLGIRDAKYILPKSVEPQITELEIYNLEVRMKRIEKKMEIR